jgi:hypothetical protein
VATAIEAALGAAGGEALDEQLGSGIGENARDTIPIGGAGVIVAYRRSAADRVESAVTRGCRR